MSESPDELRAEIDDVRAELGATVEELSRRMDVPARVRASGNATVERVREGAERAPAAVAAVGAVVVLVVGVLLRRRAGRR
jgi:ElaB/YqjD/DUF883 family membrane-anchored ribosome-binding protein